MNPTDWYWIVGGDATQVYSSAANIYVPASDPAFALKKQMACPASIATEAELWELLQAAAPAFLPAWLFDGTTFSQPAAGAHTKTQLAAYAAYARVNRASGGVVVASISAIPFLSDPLSRNTVNSAYQYAKANPGHVTHWKMSDGSFVPLSDTQMATANDEMTIFIQACFNSESNVIDGLNDGTITTLAQVDAVFDAIPSTAPVIASLQPTTSAFADAPIELFVLGSNFGPASEIILDGYRYATSVVSQTELVAIVGGRITGAGTFPVQVHDAGGLSNIVQFTFT